MSKLEKLVASLLSETNDHSFSDLEKVLLAFGFVEVRSRGSHHVFQDDEGRKPISIPKKGGKKVKKTYVKRVVQILKLEEWYEQQKE